jgi:hypothetical protein
LYDAFYVNRDGGLVVVQSEIYRAMNPAGLWETVGMAKKRTKADKALRQADRVEKKTETRPEQAPKKQKP